MKRLWRLFGMPWVAAPAYARWIVGLSLGVVLLWVLPVAAAAGATDADAAVWAATFAIWALWAGYVCGNFQLQRDARKLCLPRIAREGDHSMLLFAGLSVALPIVIAWGLGAPQPFAAGMFVIAAISGLTYMMVPMHAGIPMVVGEFLLLSTYGSGMPAMAWLALLAPLLAIGAWRWRQFRSVKLTPDAGWNAAAVFRGYRMFAARRGVWFGSFTQSFLQRQLARPTRFDMHQVGPDRPVVSLRVALGGLGAPKPWTARLVDVGLVACYVLVFSLVSLIPQAFTSDRHALTAAAINVHWISPLLMLLGALGGLVAVTAFAGRTLTAWSKPDAELALLALLPGLTHTARSRRDALCALLLPVAAFVAVTAAALCLGAFDIHAKPWVYGAIALCCVGSFGLSSAVTLEALGGHGVHRTMYVIGCGVLLLLTMFMLIATLPTDQYKGPLPWGVPPVWLLTLWAVFLLVIGGAAFEGWRDLRKRPHPFLASAQ